MKKMSKMSAVALALVLLLSLAVGCKPIDEKPSASPTTTTGEPSTSPNTDSSAQPIVTPTPNARFDEVALTVDGVEIKVSEYNYYYRSMLENYLSSTYNMGADMTKSLKDQAPMMGGQEGETVDDMLHRETIDQIKMVIGMCKAAEKAGIVLDEADNENVAASIKSVEDAAKENNATANDLISNYYGYGTNVELLKRSYERMMLANKYYEKYRNDLQYTDAEIEAEYAKSPSQYAIADFRMLTIDGSATGLAETATDEEKTAATEQAMSAAKAKADAMQASAKDEASFIAQATINKPADDADFNPDADTKYVGADAAAMSEEAALWVFDAARKAGDCAVIKESTGYSVILFSKAYKNEQVYSVDVRHILCAYDETKVDEAGLPLEDHVKEVKAAAEKLYNEYLAGDKSEDSFAALAKANSGDPGSKDNGGLYQGVQRGQMVTAFNDWCFDPARKVGDSGIVATDFGYHIMYMSKLNGTFWKESVVEALRNGRMETYLKELASGAQAEIKEFDRTFVDTLIQPAADDGTTTG